IKTDHEVLTNDHLSLRYNRQTFTGGNFENGNSSNALQHTGDSLVHTDTFSLVNSNVFTSSIFNEVRAQWAKDSEPGKANSTDPEAQVNDSGIRILNIGSNTFSPRETTIRRKQIADTLTYIWGSHSIKGGFDVNQDKILNFFPGNFFGSYSFSSLANFSKGIASSYLQAFPGPGTTGGTTHPDMTEYAVFVHDEWRVTPNITVNAGLRYDFQDVAQPTVHNPDAQLAAAGLDTAKIPQDKNEIGPRLGIAWTPSGASRTVVRGGYGIFYGRTPSIMVGTAHSNNGINVQTISFTGSLIPQYPNVFSSLPTGVTLPKPTIFVFAPNFKNPKVQQASLGVEQGLTSDLTFGVTYQWVKGSDLPRTTDINVGASTTVTTPVIDGLTGASLGNATYKQYSSVRPFTNFARILEFQSSAHSQYNGVTLDFQKRFSNNWQARLAYTYSKVKDDRPDATAVVPGTDDPKYAQDPLDLGADYAPGDNDVRHRLVLSGVWSLDAYAQNIKGTVLHALLSGWSVSGIAAYQSGQPYTALVNADLNNDGNNRNDRAPGFARNSFNLPSQVSIDPRITRDIHVFNSIKLQLIAEAFNVTNRSNVNGVRTTYYTLDTKNNVLIKQSNPVTGFGTPSSSNGPRIMQLAAKISF
ncbi:MAG TPA: TonB-dependent receptor, partial [Thermoanaerobaculia bacterium]|nr:TonB-dependent receptor [Thermoanaerobaculia bacterium]